MPTGDLPDTAPSAPALVPSPSAPALVPSPPAPALVPSLPAPDAALLFLEAQQAQVPAAALAAEFVRDVPDGKTQIVAPVLLRFPRDAHGQGSLLTHLPNPFFVLLCVNAAVRRGSFLCERGR